MKNPTANAVSKVGRPKGIKRQSITLSLPREQVEWLRSTGCASQVVQEAVQVKIDSAQEVKL